MGEVNNTQHLLEVESTNIFVKLLLCYEVEQFSTSDQLKSQVGNLSHITIRLYLNCVFFGIYHFDRIGVVENSECLKFSSNSLNCNYCIQLIRFVKDLQRDSLLSPRICR